VGVVVQKYGGSSVADVHAIGRVAERIASTRRQGLDVVAVVSAMGKTTDQLLALAREVAPAPPRRELDMLLSCGERISMALLSMAINELGYEAISFTGSQCGIITNDRHSGARIIEVRPVRVQDELERGRIVIVAGFQGVSYKREITTLGRGGSDTTAVALAAALGAEYCEICSDVAGVYSADPNLVDAAKLRKAISHDEMEELATHGAKVLHAQAIEFARQSGIALYARATRETDGGTRIDARGGAYPVVGVTGQKNLVYVAGDLARLADLGARALQGDGRRGSGYLCLDDVPDWPRLRSGLHDLDVREHMGAVSVVGRGVEPTQVLRAAASLVESGAIEQVATSALRVTLYCAEALVDDLVRSLHGALVV
jgi:aspartate kinase